ncbi:T9SS type A sorting domain-containing protein [Aureisphaera galaxeae]|uniref:T9SS type A sorting domain-containing protein n=1 Tax=Aureisphaera galaxeae TaxID=1538023 RepID=UPI00235092CB|nr:T9SS type A sorting domain-containing protein [Aureisphaera galaxeae]MDC8005870.1 T9SS type A sorting domain-containing protein [Aureisphaera galaxeae]
MLRNYLTPLLFLIAYTLYATDYHIGPGQPLTNISEAPWDALQAGDRIYIHWRDTPYYEKWVINAQGTELNRIEIIGVDGPEGQKPIIDGNGATTPLYLDYWNESRGLIKIGGSSIPSDGLPSYITIRNLELKSVRPAYSFTGDNGQTDTYSSNAASVYIEKGQHIIIEDCIIHDSGNGIFIGANGGDTQDILIANNYIYDNGISGSIFEHNTYTEALGITYEYNRFGPLRAGALGNNLKDRSAGLVVRYNWIESGNRQLDLVDSGSAALYNHPSYSTTYAYGNILIEPDGAGNSQIAHYGGDSGTQSQYRKGNFYFYNNTVISTRNSNTTLVRLSSQDETMDAFNNVIYTTNSGSTMAMINDAGTFNLYHNWIKTNWVNSHSGSPSGTVNDQGNNLDGTDPLFTDLGSQDFSLQNISPLINAGTDIPAIHLPDNDLLYEYLVHSSGTAKNIIGNIDIGAFEYQDPLSLNNLVREDIQIYPNPVTDVFHISMEQSMIKEVNLFTVSGRKVLTARQKNQLNTVGLKSGIYILKLETIDGSIINRKISKD